MTEAMIRCLIADDQAMVREGFGALLAAQDGLEVAGLAADGAEAVALARRLRPDVVLMDVRMPVMDGLAATRELLRGPATGSGGPRVLMLTTFDLDEYVYEALRAGASGFLLKDAPADELTRAVRVVAAGDALLAPSVTRRLIADYARLPFTAEPRTSGTSKSALRDLTPRETEVLRLIARGLSNAEISAALVIAEQTTKTHVGRILMKLGLRDRAQAVVVAYESGLVTPGDGRNSLPMGRNVTGVQGNAANLDDLDRLFETVKREKGRIDVLFASAGTGEAGKLGEITEEHFDTIFGLNTRGTLFTVQKALPLFNDGGSIFMTGLIASVKGWPDWGVYAASKAALHSYARVWLNELKDRKIRVNVLSPGQIATPIQQELFDAETMQQFESLIPRGKMGRPEEIATVALFLASDDSSYVNGVELSVDGGTSAI